MKKLFTLLIATIIMFSFTVVESFSAVSKKINANIKTKTVPAGTVLTLKLLNPVSSLSSQLGDQFDLMVMENVKVDNSIVIPQGSVIRGSLEDVQSAKMLYKGGSVRLYFDHIVSSTGRQVGVTAGVCNNENVTFDGALSTKTNYMTALTKTADTTKNIVVTPTKWAWEKGEDMLSGYPKYVFAPITAIVSVPVAGIYFIGDSIADVFKKGKDFSMNQGETIQVQLIKSIDMPVY